MGKTLAIFWVEPSPHARSIPMTRIGELCLKTKEHPRLFAQSDSLGWRHVAVYDVRHAWPRA